MFYFSFISCCASRFTPIKKGWARPWMVLNLTHLYAPILSLIGTWISTLKLRRCGALHRPGRFFPVSLVIISLTQCIPNHKSWPLLTLMGVLHRPQIYYTLFRPNENERITQKILFVHSLCSLKWLCELCFVSCIFYNRISFYVIVWCKYLSHLNNMSTYLSRLHSMKRNCLSNRLVITAVIGLFLSGTVYLAILLTFPRCQNSKRVCF